jgi:hypothetical protein
MAAKFEAVQSTKTVDKQTETSGADAARELVRMAKEQGLSLTGPDGLLKMLTKTVIEAALDEEMTEHLGYGKRETGAKETANSRKRDPRQNGPHGNNRARRNRGTAGPGRHVHTRYRRQAPAPFDRCR